MVGVVPGFVAVEDTGLHLQSSCAVVEEANRAIPSELLPLSVHMFRTPTVNPAGCRGCSEHFDYFDSMGNRDSILGNSVRLSSGRYLDNGPVVPPRVERASILRNRGGRRLSRPRTDKQNEASGSRRL
jgi:hypothetical protein